MKRKSIRRRAALTAAICVLFILTAVRIPQTASAGTAARYYADADNDGVVTAGDARMILRAAVGLQRFSGESRAAADPDGDGSVTAADARLALRMAVGLTPLSPSGGDNRLAGTRSRIVQPPADGRYAYPEMEEDLKSLSEAFPARFTCRSLCKTADGRDVFCAVLGSGYGASQIVIDAGIHGSEYLNPAAVMETAEYYLRNFDLPVYRGRTVRQILDDVDLIIIPMLNPDGIAISQFGLSGLRNEALAAGVRSIWEQNRIRGNTNESLADYLKAWKANANGVDLNRNFYFARSGLSYRTGVFAPANEEYAGDRLRPEAETAAYRGLIERLQNPVAVLSVHSQGGLIYWACRQNDAGKAAAMALADLAATETGYWRDDEDSFVGASADWAMIEKGIPAVTVECGRGHNPLPASELPGISTALRTLFLAAADRYGS